MATSLSQDQVREALSRVDDPEIGKPITELDMVESIAINGADVSVGVYLTIAACPMRDTIASNTRAVLEELDGVGSVDVHLHTMSDEQRRALSLKLRGEGGCEVDRDRGFAHPALARGDGEDAGERFRVCEGDHRRGLLAA